MSSKQSKPLSKPSNPRIILSWDVAAKTLAYCLGSYHPEREDGNRFEVIKWELINLFPEDYDDKLRPIISETEKEKIKKEQKAKRELKKQQKNKTTSNESIENIGTVEQITQTRQIKKKKKTGHLKKEYSLSFICERLDKELDKRNYLIKLPNEVIIENQLQRAGGFNSAVNKSNDFMKRIQVILCHYFSRYGIRNPLSPIEDVSFIHANNKLRCYDGPEIEVKSKRAYDINKELSEKHSMYILRKNPQALQVIEDYRNKIGKVDDLCDCFLQMVFQFIRDDLAEKAKIETKAKAKAKREALKKQKQEKEVIIE